MRKIRLPEILVFSIFLFFCLGVAGFGAWQICELVDSQKLYSLIFCICFILLIYGFALAVFRAFLFVRPIPVGEIAVRSKDEFTYHVYLLFFLIIFYPVIRSGLIPIPLLRVFYQLLGIKIGNNSYSSGLMMYPTFITIGSNCIVGQGSLLIPHIIEGDRLGHYPIVIGNNVTIGAHSVLLSVVSVGDGAIISIGAVVPKNTTIQSNEIWGGVPARLIGTRSHSA